ncbi:Uma2 family endonuclease [soil metagenome]
MLPQQTKRRRFDVEQYHRMLQAGILSERDRVELIDGEIVEMTPVGGRHVRCVNRLTMVLAPAADRAGLSVSVQNPLILDDNGEPEPDLALLKDESTNRENAQHVPTAGEALLVVEVSETSLSWDKNVKTPRYAGAAIPEVWIVDLASETVDIYTGPEPSGQYRNLRTLRGEDQLRCEALGDLGVQVSDVWA